MQSDWGEIVTEVGGKSVKVRFIVNELGYLRRFHFWCTTSLDAEHTYEGIIRSLEYFGGVTEEVLMDNHAGTPVLFLLLGSSRPGCQPDHEVCPRAAHQKKDPSNHSLKKKCSAC